MGRDDRLLVVPKFSPLESAFVGKDVMPYPAVLLAHFSTRFNSARTLWHEDRLQSTNDNRFIGLFFAR